MYLRVVSYKRYSKILKSVEMFVKFPNRIAQFVPAIKLVVLRVACYFLFGFEKKPAHLICRIFPILRNSHILDKDKKVCSLIFSC